jgi:hypothetical protein
MQRLMPMSSSKSEDSLQRTCRIIESALAVEACPTAEAASGLWEAVRTAEGLAPSGTPALDRLLSEIGGACRPMLAEHLARHVAERSTTLRDACCAINLERFHSSNHANDALYCAIREAVSRWFRNAMERDEHGLLRFLYAIECSGGQPTRSRPSGSREAFLRPSSERPRFGDDRCRPGWRGDDLTAVRSNPQAAMALERERARRT